MTSAPKTIDEAIEEAYEVGFRMGCLWEALGLRFSRFSREIVPDDDKHRIASLAKLRGFSVEFEKNEGEPETASFTPDERLREIYCCTVHGVRDRRLAKAEARIAELEAMLDEG
jgi:hypothetical protein